MKSSISFLFFFCSSLLFSQGNSLLWEIKGNGLEKPSYLYGTYHSKDARAQQFGDSVLAKLAKSDMVVLENIDMDPKKALGMMLMKDKKLEDLLSKDDYAFVKENILEKLGENGVPYNTMKPMLTMTMAGLAGSRKEMPYIVDKFIEAQAKEQGKGLYGLENSEEAIQSLDEISLKEQGKMLVDYFKKYDKSLVLTDSLIRIYQSQDLNHLYAFYLDQKDVPVSFDKSLIEKRNKKFLDRLIPLIKKQSVFCAVGSLHLPGETGLINGLRKKGYQVTPVYSKYTPQPVYVEDKREWGAYENDSLLIHMNFPGDPYYDVKESADTSHKISSVNYYMDDSLSQLYYMVSIVGISDSGLLHNPIAAYNTIISKLADTKGWIKITEKQITYKELPAKEAEFNVSEGINSRYRMVLNGRSLYMIGVIGNKKNIYSNEADKFFQNISFLNPSLFVTLHVTDETSLKTVDHFDVAITSSIIDTIIQPDASGYIAFTLPAVEDEFIIKISSQGYVAKKILLNTTGAFKTGQNEISINGDASMIKKKPGVDYSIYNTPVATARMLDNTNFAWDMEYILKMKETINKQAVSSDKTSK